MNENQRRALPKTARAVDGMNRMILGHEFRPMTDEDRVGLAGAEPGSLICDTIVDLILIAEPDTSGGYRAIVAIDEDGTEVTWAPVKF